MNVSAWGDAWAAAWGDSWGELASDQSVDGSGLVVTRPKRSKPYKLHPDEIARQQREDERYLAELEKKVAPTVEAKADAPALEVPVVAQLPDTIARAVSAEQVIARARASSAEVHAKAMADERRRTALLLLALD